MYMEGVKEGLNRMLNMIHEEAEESVATAWKDLEAERDGLQDLQMKMAADLQLPQGQVASQAEMLRTAKEEVARWQEELALSGNAQQQLIEENARLASELSKARAEVESLRMEHREFCSRFIGPQGPLLQAFLYKLTRLFAFGEFVNGCGDVINSLAMTDAINLISLDHPDLEIKKSEYDYDKDVREQVDWRLAEKILKVADFPLLNSLKGADHLLSAEEILGSAVDEDLMFRELDETGIVSPLGLPMVARRELSPIRPSVVPQAPQVSEFSALQDLPNIEDVV